MKGIFDDCERTKQEKYGIRVKEVGLSGLSAVDEREENRKRKGHSNTILLRAFPLPRKCQLFWSQLLIIISVSNHL